MIALHRNPASASRGSRIAPALTVCVLARLIFASDTIEEQQRRGSLRRRTKVIDETKPSITERMTRATHPEEHLETNQDEGTDNDVEQRRSRGLQMDMPVYTPLACNENVDFDALCTSSPLDLSALVAAAAATGEEVLVECGKCAVSDYVHGEDVYLPQGLRIQGKLVFPTMSNVTVTAPHIFVEGHLKVRSSTLPSVSARVPSQDGTGVKIVMTGTDEVEFLPHTQNMHACGGNQSNPLPCNVGKKSFVVAGGQLDVEGMDPACPSWETLLDKSNVIHNVTLPKPFGPKPTPQPACTRAIADTTFDVGSSGHTGHAATNQIVAPGYLLSMNRNSLSAGPGVFIDPQCVVPDQQYILTGRARLTSTTGTPPSCTSAGSGTPKCLRLSAFLTGYPFLGKMDPGQASSIIDGEWFNFTFPLAPLSSEQLNSASVHMFYWFWNPEASVEIALDELEITLPSDDAYPDPETGCLDLVTGNGDAESNGLSPYPFSNPENAGNNYLSIKIENTNKYFSYERTTNDGMWYKFNPGCLEDGITYTVKMKWRLNSTDAKGLRLRFRWKVVSGSWDQLFLDSCPESSSSIGWVDCEVDMIATSDMLIATEYELYTFTNGISGTIDYDNITFTRSPTYTQSQIVISQDAAKCWAPGAQLVITSNTYTYTDDQVVTIEHTDPTTGIITLSEELNQTTSAADNTDFAVEVGLLNRNFVLVGGNDDTNRPLHGGHLIILHTPHVAQKIMGIEIKNFGQQGIIGKYPIHFHMSNTVSGSVISKNVIHQSNQRCVVIHGSHNITIEENVAFDAFGHCYYLEDGGEVNNTFRRNLGTAIKKFNATELSASGGRDESDDTPAVFSISNPHNYWYENVAAGSEEYGFWVETFPAVRGPSASLNTGVVPTKLSIYAFKDNVAHSSKTHGFSVYPPSYVPIEESIVENLRSYRNYDTGVLLHVVQNMKFTGGLVADNGRYGVRINRGDNITLDGIHVIGRSPNFLNMVLPLIDSSKRCPGSNLTGISFHPTLETSDIDGFTRGLTLKNVDLSHISTTETQCDNSVALYMEKAQVSPVFDCPTSFQNVSIDSNAKKINACDAKQVKSIDDVALEDIDGSFSPNGNTPGFLVSPEMTAFVGGQCTAMEEGSCLSFCAGACLRTVTFRTSSAASTEGFEMVVTDGTTTQVVERHMREDHFSYETNPVTECLYGISLPNGNYNVSFRDSTGSLAWPEYVVPVFQSPPTCSNHLTSATLNIIKPSPSRCSSELVKNGNFESGNTDGWQAYFTDAVFTSSGESSSGALKTTGSGIVTQWIDVSCLVAGEAYEASAAYRLVDENDNNVDCGDNCPRLVFAFTYYDPEDPNNLVADEYTEVAVTVNYQTEASAWNVMEGAFNISFSAAESMKVQLMVLDYELGHHIVIDNVSVKQVCPSNLVIVDANFDVGSNGYTGLFSSNSIKPHDTNNNIERSPGFLSSTSRAVTGGPGFTFDTKCVIPYKAYILTGKARLSSSEVTPACTSGGSGGSCLKLSANLDAGANPGQYVYFGGMDEGEANIITAGQWFDFTIPLKPFSSSQLISQSSAYFWLYNAEAQVDIDLDFAKIFPAYETNNCDDLVTGNGDAESNGISPYPFSNLPASNNPATFNFLSIGNEEDINGNTINSYFKHERFGSIYGMFYRFKPGCLSADKTYTIRLRWRLHSVTASKLRLRFGIQDGTNSWDYMYLQDQCPESSETLGWINCEVNFNTTSTMLDAVQYELFSLPVTNIESAGPYGTIDYDDISIKLADTS